MTTETKHPRGTEGSRSGAIFFIFFRFRVSMKKIMTLLAASALILSSCIEDSFDTSPSAQPRFSVEECLDMGVQFTENPSPTAELKIYNPNGKLINLSSVRFETGRYFRMNVDGRSGSEFRNVEIRPNDSVYVFIECTLPQVSGPEPAEISDRLLVETNGVVKSLPVKALAQNVVRHRRETITGNVSLDPALPHVVFDTLRVAPGATLTLPAGTSLLFHDKAALIVEGTLRSEGTVQEPVRLRGDRTGNVVAQISYDVMSNQWEGVRFTASSRGNRLEGTEILNTCQGVAIDSLADLTMVNSRLYNSGTIQLAAGPGASVTALGCEISNAASALLLLDRGTYLFDRCTIANWYLFKWPDMAIIELLDAPNTSADFVNSIIYGRDTPIGDYDNVEEVNIWFRRCMFAVSGADDARYIDCLWDADPKLDYSLTDYTFDYSPAPDSPAAGAAMGELDSADLPLADRRGRPRGLALGCYAPAEPN